MMTVMEHNAVASHTSTDDSETRDVRDRRQAAVVELGRRAMAPSEISTLLNDAASLAAETLGAESSSVAEPVGTEDALRLRFATVDEREPPETADLSAEPSQSLAGYTLQVGHPLNVSDIASDQRFRDEFLTQHAIRSAIACPLVIGNQVFGAIGIYSNEPDRFADEDLLFVESISHVATATLARERAEVALEQQTRFATTVLKTVESLVIFLDEQGKIAGANRIFKEITGFDVADVRGRALAEVLIMPYEVELIERALGKLRCGLDLVDIETQLQTKCNESRQVAWNLSAVRGNAGEVNSYVASAIDVTEQRRVERELKQARATLNLLKQSDDAAPSNSHTASGFTLLPEDDEVLQPFRRLPRGPSSDRREKPRRAYPYVQLIAPIYDGKMPSKESFTDVRCRDIGAGGFSFATREQPDFNGVVVAFGSAPKLTYLTAEVVHVTHYEREGNVRYILGCRYLGRAPY